MSKVIVVVATVIMIVGFMLAVLNSVVMPATPNIDKQATLDYLLAQVGYTQHDTTVNNEATIAIHREAFYNGETVKTFMLETHAIDTQMSELSIEWSGHNTIGFYGFNINAIANEYVYNQLIGE